jgi:hypothetical protein
MALRCVSSGSEDVEVELAELAAAGFSCGCRGGACSLPVEGGAAGDNNRPL